MWQIGGGVYDLGQTFALHSDPAALHSIYLDFNGHSMASSQWENGGALQLRPFYSDFSSEANLLEIQRIWQRIAEDFAPFQVNVTTQEPISDDLRKTSSTDPRWGVRMAFTYNENLATGQAITNAGGGGTAYIGSFNWSQASSIAIVSRSIMYFPPFSTASSDLDVVVLGLDYSTGGASTWQARISTTGGTGAWVNFAQLGTTNLWSATITAAPFSAGVSNVVAIEVRNTAGGAIGGRELLLLGYGLAFTP